MNEEEAKKLTNKVFGDYYGERVVEQQGTFTGADLAKAYDFIYFCVTHIDEHRGYIKITCTDEPEKVEEPVSDPEPLNKSVFDELMKMIGVVSRDWLDIIRRSVQMGSLRKSDFKDYNLTGDERNECWEYIITKRQAILEEMNRTDIDPFWDDDKQKIIWRPRC